MPFAYLFLQKALGQTQWKEYFSSGRKYYYNVSPGVLRLTFRMLMLVPIDGNERIKMGYAGRTAPSTGESRERE